MSEKKATINLTKIARLSIEKLNKNGRLQQANEFKTVLDSGLNNCNSSNPNNKKERPRP